MWTLMFWDDDEAWEFAHTHELVAVNAEATDFALTGRGAELLTFLLALCNGSRRTGAKS
jgi:hypothetical protein